MVTEDKLTREQLREIDRQQRIDLALAAGNQKLAEWIRTEMEYDDNSTPEEDAEDARISAERIAEGKFVELEELERRMDKQFPEEAKLFRRLDKDYPDWLDYLHAIPPDSTKGIEFLGRLDREFPEAAELIRSFH